MLSTAEVKEDKYNTDHQELGVCNLCSLTEEFTIQVVNISLQSVMLEQHLISC